MIGNESELARELFDQSEFVSVLQSMSSKPTFAIGGSLNSWAQVEPDEDEEDLHVRVPKIVTDVRQLIAMVDLTKSLLDRSEANGCPE